MWGNAFIAKLLQIKYFSIRHLGIIQVNDAGCSFRCIKNESLQQIVNDFTSPNSNEFVFGANFITIGMFTTTKAIEHDLKIVEIPVRYRAREYGETNIDRWRHGLLLLKMVIFAAKKIKFV